MRRCWTSTERRDPLFASPGRQRRPSRSSAASTASRASCNSRSASAALRRSRSKRVTERAKERSPGSSPGAGRRRAAAAADPPMNSLTKRLADFSDDELWEEFLRRRNGDNDGRRDDIRFCDACEHFVAWSESDDPPKTYNPCSFGHDLSFRLPVGYSDELGFFRRVCPDRLEIEDKSSL